MIVLIFLVSLLTRRSFDRDLTRIRRQLTSLENNNNNSDAKPPKNEHNEQLPSSTSNKEKEVISMVTFIGKKLGIDNKSASCGNFTDSKPPKHVSDLQISRLNIAKSRNSSTNNTNNNASHINQVDETTKL